MSSETRLKITGMTCGHCVAHTKKALEAVPGVVEADVSLEPGGAVVKGEASADALVAAVKDAGYEAQVES
ncbi:CopZ family metallochaperone [Thiolapillus sp.]